MVAEREQPRHRAGGDAGHGPDDDEHRPQSSRAPRRRGPARRTRRPARRARRPRRGCRSRAGSWASSTRTPNHARSPASTSSGGAGSRARSSAARRSATRPRAGLARQRPEHGEQHPLHPAVPQQVGAGRPDAGVPAGEVLVVGHRHRPVQRAYPLRRGGAGLLQRLGRRPAAGRRPGW